MTGHPRQRNTVFISYSHVDREWLERLRPHLKPLERYHAIRTWDDSRIQPGARWNEEIRSAIESCRVAVLLVSAAFLASDFIGSNEVPPLLEAAEREGAVILPLILKGCSYKRIPALSEIRAINDPERPLIALPEWEQEDILDQVAQRIGSIFDGGTRSEPAGRGAAASFGRGSAPSLSGASPGASVDKGIPSNGIAVPPRLPIEAPVISIAGTWYDPQRPGNYSVITQQGRSFAYEGHGSLLNGLAFRTNGTGTIDGEVIISTYSTWYSNGYQSSGRCEGRVVGNGARMESMCADSVVGQFGVHGVRA
jgi:hypothetical protein